MASLNLSLLTYNMGILIPTTQNNWMIENNQDTLNTPWTIALIIVFIRRVTRAPWVQKKGPAGRKPWTRTEPCFQVPPKRSISNSNLSDSVFSLMERIQWPLPYFVTSWENKKMLKRPPIPGVKARSRWQTSMSRVERSKSVGGGGPGKTHASPSGGKLLLNSIFLVPAASIFKRTGYLVFYKISEVVHLNN